jgi:hypothetical protein
MHFYLKLKRREVRSLAPKKDWVVAAPSGGNFILICIGITHPAAGHNADLYRNCPERRSNQVGQSGCRRRSYLFNLSHSLFEYPRDTFL